LEHDAPRAVAQHEAIAVAVPGAARFGGRVVALRQRARRAEPGEADLRAAVLGAARHHDVRVAVLDHSRREPDAVRARRAGRNDRKVRARHAVVDRQMPRDHVDDARGHEERRDAAWTRLEHLRMVHLDRVNAAYSRADCDTVAMRGRLFDLDARVANSLHAGRDAVEHEWIALARFLRLHVSGRVEIADRAGEASRERAHVVLVYRCDPADAVANLRPTFCHRVTARRNEAEARDYDALRHGRCLRGRGKGRSCASGRSRLGVASSRIDIVDCLLDGSDLFGFFVWNLGLEFLFEGHDELDGIQGVRAQVVHERGVVLDLVRLEAELLGNDSSDLFFHTAHVRDTPVYLTGRTIGPSRGGAYCMGINLGVLPGRVACRIGSNVANLRAINGFDALGQCISMPPFTLSVSPVI